jgi:hypothetical protein
MPISWEELETLPFPRELLRRMTMKGIKYFLRPVSGT